MKIKMQGILASLFLLSVFLLAFNNIYDPDAWGHLSHGRLIWELKGLPKNEIFIYPSTDMPYINNAWLFGLFSYIIYLVSDVYGLVLLKATTVTMAFFILLKDSLRPVRNHPLAILVLTVTVVLTQFRFILRPDIFLIVFLSYSIFSINSYLYEDRKYIYSLPLVHMLWANFGSSINIAFVPFAAFIAGGFVHRLLAKRGIETQYIPSISKIKNVAAVLFGSLLATLINPNFIGQYLISYDILSLEWSRQEIVELQPPSGGIFLFLIIVVLLISLSFALNYKRLSIIHVFTVIPFIIPAFMVKRLILLVIVVGAPMIIRNISLFLENRHLDSFFQKKTVLACTAAWIVVYCLLSIAKVGPFGEPHMKFGSGFDYFMVPKGAVDYMDKKGIQGRMMNTFHFGHYLIWTGHPDRQVFIDGRGYLEEDLLDKSNTFRYIKSALDDLYKTYGFETVLIEYPKQLGNLDLTLRPPDWALVYWDDKSLLFLRKGGEYDAVINQDEYRLVRPYMPFDLFVKSIGDKETQTGIERELKRNIADTGSALGHTMLGILYSATGRYKEAIDTISDSSDSYTDQVILGDSYTKTGDINYGIKHYLRALELEKNAAVMYKIGAIYISKGETEDAEKYISDAIRIKPDMVYAYPILSEIYNRLGESEKAENTMKQYQSQIALKSASRHIENGEKAYQEKRYANALDEFNLALKITPTDHILLTDIGYVYYDLDQLQTAYDYFTRALDISPSPADATQGLRLPNAHYGLGLVYSKTGDKAKAIKHFKQYIKTEPSGFYSRSAKKHLRKLSEQ